jgi:hypothetical protein
MITAMNNGSANSKIRKNKMSRTDEIRIIAYVLWVQNERDHYNTITHWLDAEAIWQQHRQDVNTSHLVDKDIPDSGMLEAS